MNMRKQYILILLSSGVLGVGIQFIPVGAQLISKVLELDINALSIFLISVYLLFAHLPILLPVSTVNKLLKPALVIKKYPEITFCASLFIGWVAVGVIFHQAWAGIFLGVGAAIGIGVGFRSVRIYSFTAKMLDRRAAPNPSPELAPLHNTILRYTYVFRALAGAASLIAVLAVMISGGKFTYWPLIIVILCGLAAVAFSAVGFVVSQRQAENAQRTAGAAIVNLENDRGGADVLLYCSDKTSAKHLRIKSLTSSFKKEGFKTAIVAREPATFEKVKKFGADYVWSVPYLAGTDAAARSKARAVFYTHDGVKNGHFTRFPQYAHVLDATTGTLARTDNLSTALDMYDYVIAPTPEVAAAWRAPLPKNAASKVITLGLKPLTPFYDRGLEVLAGNVALCLPPVQTTYDQVPPKIMAGIAALVERYRRVGEEAMGDPDPETGERQPIDKTQTSQLFLSVATSKTSTLTPWHKTILALTRDKSLPLVSHHVGSPTTIWNKADIIIATTLNQVVELRGTGKPLLWLGEGDAPDGVIAFDPNLDAPLHVVAQPATPMPYHFTSYTALLNYVVTDTTAQGDAQ